MNELEKMNSILKSSILDKSFNELISMDIDELRECFLEEVRDLAYLDDNVRDFKIDQIFKCLFRLQPDQKFKKKDLFREEHRLFVDLISVPGLADISYVRDYLKKFESDHLLSKKKELLLDLFDYYDKHSKLEIDKFNYVFRSNSSFSYLIIDGKIDFDDIFDDRLFRLFDKETLSQLFRGNLQDVIMASSFRDEFLKCSDKSLFLISLMSKKVKNMIGHDAEFIGAFRDLLFDDVEGINKLLESFYDNLVKDEDVFRDEFLNKDAYWEMNQLISDICFNTYGFFEMINSYESYREYTLENRFFNNTSIIKRRALDKIGKDSFDFFNDFCDINDGKDLIRFKEGILSNIYGISLENAIELVKVYGRYMDDLERDIVVEDKKIYSVLEAIKNIVDLDIDDDNFNDKLNVLRVGYYNCLLKYGFDYRDKYFSNVVLEGLFNKMFIDTYNKDLFKSGEVLFIDNGTLVIDASVDFKMMLTALNVVNSFYDTKFNMFNQWNTAFFSGVHGLCCSHISNENLGVIKVSNIMLGFKEIPDYALNKMGVTDIYSMVESYDLRKRNNSYSFFCPSSIIDSECRYGYNEFLLDRFLANDSNNSLKLQPNYVVFYKFDGDYRESKLYKDSLKIALEFKVPVVVVDVSKIKENESREIGIMEEELFSLDSVDCCLMKKIVNRYMNNYTGSLCMVYDKNVNYDEDFSIKGMDDFFDKLILKINSISDKEEREKWILALEEVYLEEKKKFKHAKSVSPFNDSIRVFGLKKYDLERRIEGLRKGEVIVKRHIKDKIVYVNKNGQIVDENNNYEVSSENIRDIDSKDFIIKVKHRDSRMDVFVRDEEMSPELETVISFMNGVRILGGTNFLVDDLVLGNDKGKGIMTIWNRSQGNVLMENLILSYFFESDKMIISDLVDYDFDCDIAFKCTDNFDFNKVVGDYHGLLDKKSPDYVPLEMMTDLDKALSSIENMPNNEFLDIFKPVIEKYSKDEKVGYEVIADRLLVKKEKMRSCFDVFNVEKNLDKKSNKIF